MDTRFRMTWDENELARAFKVKVEDIREYLTDGRRVSFIIERRLRWENAGWTLAPSEGAGYDLRDPDGGLWEVRSITRGGVYFNPSFQVGSGRKFEEGGFLSKLSAISGYILADVVEFPTVNIFKITARNVHYWYESKRLGSNAKISRKKFYSELEPLIED